MRVRFLDLSCDIRLTLLDYHLHEYILALWGMPLGEMLDLEKLAQTCREKNRWFFFFTSAPANCPGTLFTPSNKLLQSLTAS